MAVPTFQIALAAGKQTARGTTNSTIAGLTGSLTTTDGIVLGDPSGGKGETGIDGALVRDLLEKSRTGLTRQASDLVGTKVDGLQIVIPLKGNGATATSPTPVDGDAQPDPGIEALWYAAGLSGAAWGSGTGWAFTLTDSDDAVATVKVWIGPIAIVVKDVVASVDLEFKPGEIGRATFELAGTIDTAAAAAFPTLNYGNQASLSAPIVQNVAHRWGITDELRGFSEMTISIDNSLEEVLDSNVATGKTQRRSARDIQIEATIYGSTTDDDFELTELQRTSGPDAANDLEFTVGSAMTGGGTVNAYRPRVPLMELRKFEPEKLGTGMGWKITGVATGTTAATEFELIYL